MRGLVDSVGPTADRIFPPVRGAGDAAIGVLQLLAGWSSEGVQDPFRNRCGFGRGLAPLWTPFCFTLRGGLRRFASHATSFPCFNRLYYTTYFYLCKHIKIIAGNLLFYTV